MEDDSSPYHAELPPRVALSWEEKPGIPKSVVGDGEHRGFERKVRAGLKSPPCRSRRQRESVVRKATEKMRKQDDPFAVAITKCTADHSGPSDDSRNNLGRSFRSTDGFSDGLGRSCRLGRKASPRSSSSEAWSFKGDESGSDQDDDEDFMSQYLKTRKLFMM
ncbi:hypothetical protein MLD38_012982 [Melastoma candidum]|uniref:Uncharacterized protein n=1 Tax=Melastoma candidum TaxID=119954 RepID=A0ACB9R833_9MYRT|nr:hypothetical protein MLD38_012982 [Melastoma candidum]